MDCVVLCCVVLCCVVAPELNDPVLVSGDNKV